MNRSTLVAILLTLMVIVGVVIAFLSSDGHEEDLPHTPPLTASRDEKPLGYTPAQNQDIEVFFITSWDCIPLPLDTPTVIDRGDLLVYGDDLTDSTNGNGSGGWETKVLRTATHLTITTASDIGHYRKMEYSVPLSDLPMDFPIDKIQTMIDGRFEVTRGGQSSGPAGHTTKVFFTGHETNEIHYGRPTMIGFGSLSLTTPQGGIGWEIAVRRTSTHAIIINTSIVDGQSRKTEYPIPLTDLPLELPSDKIPIMVHGRLYTAAK